MNYQLKKAIIDFIFDNGKEFQINNVTNQEFREYIYNKDGNYLIGGEDVAKFIENAIKLII